jgi:hypothetical protein
LFWLYRLILKDRCGQQWLCAHLHSCSSSIFIPGASATHLLLADPMRNLLLIIIFLAACNTPARNQKRELANGAPSRPDSAIQDTDESGILAPPEITDPAEKHILSHNDTLYLGDTLRFMFKTPHPRGFGVVDPNNKFLYLVYADYNVTTKPTIDFEAFAGMNTLELPTRSAKANPWTAGKQDELIFTIPGTYVFKLSEMLATDDGTPVESVNVFFTGKPR